MAVTTTEKIWHNGKLIAWDDAKIHVMAHVVNYGSAVFEGVRCYAAAHRPGDLPRPGAHASAFLIPPRSIASPCPTPASSSSMPWLKPSAPMASGPATFARSSCAAMAKSASTRSHNPTECYVANYPWGKYLGGSEDVGVDVCVSSWTRLAPNTLPSMAKAGANYMNSQLIKMEAVLNGYVEGIALDVNGYVSEGSGENIFLVRNGKLLTPPLGNSVLAGITRDSVLRVAQDLGIPLVEQVIPRELLYLADEVFFTGTAAEVTPIRSVDKITVGDGTVGPVTKAIRHELFCIFDGSKPDRYNWLTPVPVRQKVGA